MNDHTLGIAEGARRRVLEQKRSGADPPERQGMWPKVPLRAVLYGQ